MSRDAPLWRTYLAWRSIAGPLADFVLPAPFFYEGNVTPHRPHHQSSAALAGVLGARAAGGDSLGMLVLLEAPLRLGLAAGVTLAARGWWVAPMFGRWPAERPVLPVAPLCGWLRWGASELQPLVGGARPVGAAAPLLALLDAERQPRVAARVLHRCFDNRYEYNAHMLPPAGQLCRWGVRRVLWAGASADLPDDLSPYGEALADGGLAFEAVRLPGAGGVTERNLAV